MAFFANLLSLFFDEWVFNSWTCTTLCQDILSSFSCYPSDYFSLLTSMQISESRVLRRTRNVLLNSHGTSAMFAQFRVFGLNNPEFVLIVQS
jgi:hypothetical protein